MPLLHSTNLQFAFSEREAFEFPDIEVEGGQSLVIIGPSGSGKTTLLHLLAGLRRPTAGSVHIGATDLAQLSETQLDRFRGQQIGLVHQQPHFVQSLSTRQNLALPSYCAKTRQNTAFVNELANRLGLKDQLQKRAHQLSQGQQQRLSIARAIANRPKLILADEPTSALDDANCNAVLELLQHEAGNVGAALVIVTHDQRVKSHFANHISL